MFRYCNTSWKKKLRRTDSFVVCFLVTSRANQEFYWFVRVKLSCVTRLWNSTSKTRSSLIFFTLLFRNCKSCVYNCDDLLSCNCFIFVKVWRVFIQQTHFLGWSDIRTFRIQRRFVWLTIDETYGWVHLREEKKSGVKVPCLRKQRDGRGLNPGPPDPEFEVSSAW